MIELKALTEVVQKNFQCDKMKTFLDSQGCEKLIFVP